PPPTGLTATAGNAQVALSWTASTGATGYNVKRSTTNGGPYTTVASPAGTSFTNTNLTNGTTFFFVVTATNASGESANSSQVSATPQAPNFALSVTPNTLTVTRGASGTRTVTITRTGGFTGSVDLSTGTLPTGVTASFSPDPTTAGSSTLTINASSTATLG